ncbi:MAG: class I SAM-dependent methyltransferase [Candidatus Riflebacteria bacterium]|nr:class I SAM-dependent methyltransferase [Candidatus Riflebacteria bacterium]
MRPATLPLLRCPGCLSGDLVMENDRVHGEFVMEGTVRCRCGHGLPVVEGVLDLRPGTPDAVVQDGQWWGAFFREQSSIGLDGYLDLAEPVAPFLHLGLPEPFPRSPQGKPERLANFEAMLGPLAAAGGWALDVGAGAGWASHFLGRRGFQVIAVDPAWEAVALGQREAVRQGLPIDYACGGVAQLALADRSIDLAVALHALHHVPGLDSVVGRLFDAVRVGGHIFVDDHHSSSVALASFHAALMAWARQEIFPNYPTHPVDRSLPASSPNEDVSLGRTLPSLCRYFHVRSVSFRPVFLDTLPYLFYLKKNRSMEAYALSQELTADLGKILGEAFPWCVEYVTFTGRRGPDPARCSPPASPAPGLPDLAPPGVPTHLRRFRELVQLQKEIMGACWFKARRHVERLVERLLSHKTDR